MHVSHRYFEESSSGVFARTKLARPDNVNMFRVPFWVLFNKPDWILAERPCNDLKIYVDVYLRI